MRPVPLPAAAGLLLVAACAAPPAPEAPRTVVWRGEVAVEEDVVLPPGTDLRLEPGTRVRFAFRDDDGDGWGDASLRLRGALVARGTPEAPVVFTSREPAEPGRWGEVRVDFGSLDLRYVVVEGSTRGLHAHFSGGRVRDCLFRRNVDGTRLGDSRIEVAHCLFYGHPGKALNARNCRNRVHGNRFHHNRNGIFLFASDAGSTFRGNAFRANEHPLRLGDFFRGAVAAAGNDWGGDPPRGGAEGAELRTAPDRTGRVGRAAGVRGWPAWEASGDGGAEEPSAPPPEAHEDRGGGVRYRPVPVAGALAAPTGDGRLLLLDGATGAERDCWELGGPAVGAPEVAGTRVRVGVGPGREVALEVITVPRDAGDGRGGM